MYKLDKKPIYLRLQDKVLLGMEEGKYLGVGKKIVNLTSYMDHYISSKRCDIGDDNNYINKELSKKENKIVMVTIKNKYDTSYVSSFFEQGTFTLVHLGCLTEEDKKVWQNEIGKNLIFYGRMVCIEPDLYALVPYDISFKEDKKKVHVLNK